jgi:hypothetical protein
MTATLPATGSATRPGKSIASLLAQPATEIGPAVRLADSPLWQRQRSFYTGGVAQIWGTSTAPHAITVNARIAHTYARIAAEFLRSAAVATTHDVPHVVEVGGGSGRFAYLFVRALRSLAPDLAFRYVLTDFCAERIETWRADTAFQQFIADGALDFAVLDADDPGPLELIVSGRRLDEGALDAPVIGIANYVFDTLRHDGYAVRAGSLSQLRLAVDANASPDEGGIHGEWESAAAGELPADLRTILEHYRDTLDDTTVLVPVGGMRIVDHLRSLTSAPVCTLVADKGHTTVLELCSHDTPAVVWHGGAFSVMVNFDLLARWVRQRGGAVALPLDPARSLVVAAFLEGDPDGRLAALPAFVQDQLLDTGPDNFFTLRTALRAATNPTIDEMLAVLRLSRFDPGVFAELVPALLEVLSDVADGRRTEIERALRRVDENWFDIGEPIDMALCLGLTFGAMSRFDVATGYLERSVRAHPDNADAALALAVALRGKHDLGDAMRWVDRALQLEPTLAEARTLRVILGDELGRGA